MRRNEKLVAIEVSRDDLIQAASNLNDLADYIGAFFRDKNYEGKGAQDEADARKDILTGAKACMILLSCIDDAGEKGGAVQ